MPNAVFHASGTGASIAGLTSGFATFCANRVYTYGVCVLKGYTQMQLDIVRDLDFDGAQSQSWQILHDYHFGGYAKYPDELAQFVQNFERETNIPLDPVYTAKAAWASIDQINKKTFSPGDVVVLIHSGGLQGRRGFGLKFNDENLV